MRKLVVEGIDDQHVIWALLARRDFPQVFEVEQKGGYTELLKVLPVELKASALERFGIVLDADLNAQGRWDAVRNIIRRGGFTDFPPRPEVGGAISSNETARIGVWLMPNNEVPGMLEDFVQRLVPEECPVWPLTSDFVEALPESSNRYRQCHTAKARIHTWLAVQDEPGSPMGQAITKRMLRDDGDDCNSFVNWLDRLFVQD